MVSLGVGQPGILFIPLPIMALGIFAGSVQALIFSTLAAAYIGEALE